VVAAVLGVAGAKDDVEKDGDVTGRK